MSVTVTRPPRENLIRASLPGVELRSSDAGEGSGLPLLHGNFLVFDTWTEINSAYEGQFLERFAPGAVRKTIRESRDKMRVLFQHGQDPHIGDKPLGEIIELRETDEGAYYEVELLNTSYVRDLLPALERGLYGASFRFGVVREKWNEDPGPSEHNPRGLPERTVVEAKVSEFGPVTFPAYQQASAGVRSLTDEFLFSAIRDADPERLQDMIARASDLAFTEVDVASDDDVDTDTADADNELPSEEPAPSEDDAADDGLHLADERREPETPASCGRQTNHLYGVSREGGTPSWRL